MRFSVNVNSEEVAASLNADLETVQAKLKEEVKSLAIRTHFFIANKAKNELKGFFYEAYLGRQNGTLGSNLRLHHISDTLHVIELDPKAAWIEDGRPATFMGDWLLNSPKAKTARDGSRYLAIPFTLAKLKGGSPPGTIRPALETMARAALSNIRPKISATKTAYDKAGRPISGKIAKVPMDDPGADRVSGFHSRPRSPEMAAATGLKAHEGIFYGAGAQLRQKVKTTKSGKQKVSRDIMTFRVISSKHKMEGDRWMYPEVKPFKGFEAAESWAKEQMDLAIAGIGQALGIGG